MSIEETNAGMEIEGEELEDDYSDSESSKITAIKDKIGGFMSQFKKPRKKAESDETQTRDTDEITASAQKLRNKMTGKLPGIDTILSKFKKDKDKGQTRTELEANDSDLLDDMDEPGKKDKKKFKLTPIHIIVLGALAAFVFIPDEEPQVDPVPQTARKQKVKKTKKKKTISKEKKQDEKAEATEVTEIEENKIDETEIRIDDIDTEDLVSEVEADEFKSVSEIKEEQGMTDPIEIAPIPEEQIEVSDNEDIGESEIKDNLSSDVKEMSQAPIEENIDMLGSSDLSEKLTEKVLAEMEDSFSEEIGEVDQDNNTTVPSEPVSPPVYDIPGSSLVYNCTDLHWACISKEEYQTCLQNYRWNSFKKIPTECYPVATYETERSCAIVQQNKTDRAAEIKFCRN